MHSHIVGKRTDIAKKRYFTVIKYQFFLIILFTTISYMLNAVNGYSLLIGGLVYLIPNSYFGYKHFSKKHVVSAQITLIELYASQIGKMALIAVGFALVFAFVKPISVFFLFAGFICMHISYVILQLLK